MHLAAEVHVLATASGPLAARGMAMVMAMSCSFRKAAEVRACAWVGETCRLAPCKGACRNGGRKCAGRSQTGSDCHVMVPAPELIRTNLPPALRRQEVHRSARRPAHGIRREVLDDGPSQG